MHRFILTMPTILSLTTHFTQTTAHGIPLVVSPGLNVSTNPNITAHLPSCTNLTTAPSIPCYTKLNTTAYLRNYNLTSAEVCAPGESWSKCLLQVVYESAGTNCTQTFSSSSIQINKCQPFDCASLNSTTCIQPKQSNQTNITMLEAASWYAVWNVYSVHHHIKSWATALNKTSSEHAILASINPRVANTATSVLKTLIKTYGINPNADKGILDILDNTGTEPAYGNARVRGEASTLTGAQWRALLVLRLADLLVMVNFSFGDWLGMVQGGAFSTRGLSGSEKLAGRLRMG